MPERSALDEAMRLSQARLKVKDPDLKEGEVETVSIQTVAGPMQIPWGVEGGFAVVYKFRTKSGKTRALRCFRVPMNPDIQFRYEQIGHYFAAHIPSITAEFKYHDNGIVLKENVYGQMQSKTYPLIEMEWIEGVALLEHVDELCRKRDRAGLEDLGQQWTDLLWAMRQAKVAHGDLSGRDVMVRTNGQLVLIDYDGVYIPAFAGLPPVVLGQMHYQHPQMNQRLFNEQMDNFSALVIHTALLALQLQPQLWDSFTHRNTQGKLQDNNLLFTQQDFIDPDRSSLIATLEQMGNTRLQQAVQALKQACCLPVVQVQAYELIDSDKVTSTNIPETIDVITRKEEHLSRSSDSVELVNSTIEVKKLREGFQEFMCGLQAIIAEHAPSDSSFQLNEIQFTAEITATGGFKLLGTGVGVQSSSTVTLILQRKSTE